MLSLELNTKESTNKWAALQDRRMRNIANQSLYTQTQQIKLGRMKMVLELLFSGIVYPVNYGKRGASVKVKAGAFLKDRNQLELLKSDWEKEGIIEKKTDQGTLYFMPRI